MKALQVLVAILGVPPKSNVQHGFVETAANVCLHRESSLLA